MAPFPLDEEARAVPVRIWLLGGLRAEVGGRTVPNETWRRSRVRQLVALLALSPAHRLHREQVMDALWPELDAEAAAANLRKAVHFARRALGAEQLGVSKSLVRLGTDDLWVDVDAFQRAAASGDAEGALALYGGELMPEDRFEPWAETRHDELHGMLARLLLERARELEGDSARAEMLLERLVALDPLNEPAYCELMRLAALDGQRHVALRWYRRLEETLRDGLGVEPGATARQLSDDVSAGRLGRLARDAASLRGAGPSALEDRRLVTVLVAEVAVSAPADPEQHTRQMESVVRSVRELVESGGGVIEARVGTRVLSVFGAPALGDDHGRALRVATRLRHEVPGTKVGTATGWAVLREGALGERIAGGVVDEAIAALLSTPVGEPRIADGSPPSPGRMVGRTHELGLIEQVWQQARDDRALHVAVVVGEPGLGKTRLVDEFVNRNDGVIVRRARCLPGGEGRVIAPIAEIVQAEVDDHPDVFASIEPDRSAQAWVRRLLAPLLRTSSTADARRLVEPSEVIASWLRFSTGVAALGPRVFVFEDLHWADATMLDFLAQALADAPRVPLLIVGTARPELFERTAPWLGGSGNLATIRLDPLAAEEIGELVGVDVGVVERSTVVRRAGGNPLFALELARLVREDEGIRGDLPPTIRSVVTARFDALNRQERALVQAAALAGARTSVQELGAMLDLPRDVVLPALAALEARDVVRLRADSVQFAHDVVRNVAAEQVTRRTACRLHRRLAEWLDDSQNRQDAITAVRVASHYRHAADAARVLRAPDAPQLGVLAVGSLVRAADALEGVDLEVALSQLDSATGVSSTGIDANVELRRGRLLFALGRWPEALAALSRSIDAAHAGRDRATEVEAMTMHAEVSWHAGEIAECVRALDRCAEPLSQLPAGPEAAGILGTQAALRTLTGDATTGVALAGPAVDLARTGASAWALVRCVEARGTSRVLAGDLDGYNDFLEALEIATANGLSFEVCGLYGDFAALHWQGEGPEASLAFSGKGLDIATERQLRASGDWLREVRGRVCVDAGRWDEALELAASVLGAPASRQGQAATAAAIWSARVHLWRGDTDEAARRSEWSLARARRHVVIQSIGPALITAALVGMARSSFSEVTDLMDEYLDVTATADAYRLMDLTDLVRLLIAVDRVDDAAALVDGLDAPWVRGKIALETARAVVTRATGQDATEVFLAVADKWRRYGAPFEEMFSLTCANERSTARRIADELRIPADDPAGLFAAFVVS